MGGHTPYEVDELNGPSVVVIEHARHMQVLYRSMLSGTGTRALRVYSDPKDAIAAIIADPPDVLLVDWDTDDFPGNRFLNQFRSRQLYPVCLLPVIMVMSEVRQRTCEQAIRLGAHAVLTKPVSTTRLFEYISWVALEKQKMQLTGDKYIVRPLVERLSELKNNQSSLKSKHFAQGQQQAQVESLQSDVDRILKSSFY
ncbi:response regulator [Maritalea sp.]|uniref:response regulator n=1 Tax=Maritalea sp. TaxID=2003361 RepID=UPI003EF93B7A